MCDKPERVNAGMLVVSPVGMHAAVGRGGQRCDQACRSMTTAPPNGGAANAKRNPNKMFCDTGLLPLVNPREPAGSPFCGLFSIQQ